MTRSIRQTVIMRILCVSMLLISQTACMKSLPPQSQASLEVKAAQTPSPSKCDSLLEKCAKVVQEQHEAIEVQSKLALKQEELIKVQDEQVESSHDLNKKLGVGLVLSNIVWALIIIF